MNKAFNSVEGTGLFFSGRYPRLLGKAYCREGAFEAISSKVARPQIPPLRMLPLAIPYPPEQPYGFWGPPTLTIDWCEENYVILRYVAEAINTVTNAVFIAVAILSIILTRRNLLEKRFIFAAIGFMMVGIGLWWFHMTLRYEYQLLDELPMIYATCIPFWSVFSEFRTSRQSVLIAVAVAIGANTLTFIYLYLQDPTIHQVAYALLNFALIAKTITLTKTRVLDPQARRIVYTSMLSGLMIFGVGYGLWNMDIHLCSQARAKRREWGMPYGFVLEGHAWWHIFTGIGIYYFLMSQQYVRCLLQETKSFYSFEWVWGWPVLRCTDKPGLLRYRAVKKLAYLDSVYSKVKQD